MELLTVDDQFEPERSVHFDAYEKWTARLFVYMESLYGARFQDMWGSVSDKGVMIKVWAQALIGLRRDEVARGRDALAAREWPPTLPEFIKLCRPGLSPLVAYNEALEGMIKRDQGEDFRWSHPAIFWAASKLAYDLRHQTWGAIEKNWSAVLATEYAKGQWATIPAVQRVQRLAYECAHNEASRALQQKAVATVKRPDDKVNHLAWAERAIAIAKAKGDKAVKPYTLKAAREVLGLAHG